METFVGTNPITYSGCLDALTRRFRTPTRRAEALLWSELKGRRLSGYRFERRRRVEERTIRLRLYGVVFLPFGEDEVLYNLDGVLSRIRQAIRYLPWK
jgi:very-short-patch-repair endonuclease